MSKASIAPAPSPADLELDTGGAFWSAARVKRLLVTQISLLHAEKTSLPSTLPRAYAGIGLVLGLGAPAGAFLLRVVLNSNARADPLGEIQAHAFFYAYDLLGTSIVFALAGYVAGIRAARLRTAEDFYHRLSDVDPLTGLLNTRAFHDRYGRAVQRAANLCAPLALILIDVDRLKDINDRFGHKQGSAALLRVAEAINASKRASDVAARWGGDEFAVLLEGGDEAAARRTVQAIMLSLAGSTIPDPVIPVTVTIGIAAGVPITGHSDLLALADEALYEGKRNGRNQVRVRTLKPQPLS